MRSSRIRTLLLLPLLVLGLTAVAVPSASAEQVTVTDPSGDGSPGTPPGSDRPRIFGDMTSVRVGHGEKRVRLRIEHGTDGVIGDFYSLWVDTRPRRPGPELLVSTSPLFPRFISVTRVRGFGDKLWRDTCQRRTARFQARAEVITARLPRACFASRNGRLPQSMRVAAQSTMDYGRADWAPGRETFGPWVDAGQA